MLYNYPDPLYSITVLEQQLKKMRCFTNYGSVNAVSICLVNVAKDFLPFTEPYHHHLRLLQEQACVLVIIPYSGFCRN